MIFLEFQFNNGDIAMNVEQIKYVSYNKKTDQTSVYFGENKTCQIPGKEAYDTIVESIEEATECRFSSMDRMTDSKPVDASSSLATCD